MVVSWWIVFVLPIIMVLFSVVGRDFANMMLGGFSSVCDNSKNTWRFESCTCVFLPFN